MIAFYYLESYKGKKLVCPLFPFYPLWPFFKCCCQTHRGKKGMLDFELVLPQCQLPWFHGTIFFTQIIKNNCKNGNLKDFFLHWPKIKAESVGYSLASVSDSTTCQKLLHGNPLNHSLSFNNSVSQGRPSLAWPSRSKNLPWKAFACVEKRCLGS